MDFVDKDSAAVVIVIIITIFKNGWICVSRLCTHWHRRWRRRSAVACELPAGHAAHHGVHAAPARPVAPGVGELSTALRQRVLDTLTLHLLHPVALLGDLSPQPGG